MFGTMGSCDQSLNHILQTFVRSLDRELDLWIPFVPAGKEMISKETRSEIVEWLVSLKDKFGFSLDTLFLSVDVFDRFLRRVKAQNKYLRCIAVTCFYLSAKVIEEDEVIPPTWEIVQRSECGCSEAEVLRMERCILTKLDWNLKSSPTSYEFIHLLYALVLAKCPKQLTPPTNKASHRVLDEVLVDCLRHVDLLAYSPSTVALSVLSLYLKLTWDHWLPATQALLTFAQLSDEELSECRTLVSRCLGYKLIDILRNNTATQLRGKDAFLYDQASVLSNTYSTEDYNISLHLTKAPLSPSSPVTPHPPAKRRKVEQDDDVYDDIRSLYDSVEQYRGTASCVTESSCVDVSTSAVVMSSCASQAQRGCGGGVVLHLSLLAES